MQYIIFTSLIKENRTLQRVALRVLGKNAAKVRKGQLGSTRRVRVMERFNLVVHASDEEHHEVSEPRQ